MTVWPPDCTVSSVSCQTRSATVIATVTLSPALSVPDIGVTFTLPASQSGSEIDHATGPSPPAVSVSDPPCRGSSTTVVGDTDSAPALAVAGGVVAGVPGQVAVGVGSQYSSVASVPAGYVVPPLAVAAGDLVPPLAVALGEADALVAARVALVAGSVVGWPVLPPGEPPVGTADSANDAAAGRPSVGPPPGGCAGCPS